MSSNNSDDIFAGTVKGLLDFSAEQIGSFVKRLKEKKFGFIGEERTIEIAREQYKSGEAKFYHGYIHDKPLLFLVGMGLTLRKIEEDLPKRQNLRTKILRKFQLKGLHIAEFVQNGILNRYIAILLELVDSIKDLEIQIDEVLKNIDKHSLFVQGVDRIGEVIRKSINITDSHSPTIFVISGEGLSAELLQKDFKKIEDSLKRYSLERISTSRREILFFKRNS